MKVSWFQLAKAAFKEWRRKREWNAELQLHYLRIEIMSDARWLAHDNTARELTERYLKMLDDRWESQPREDIRDFRLRIGLDPHCSRKG